ncbi:zinc finger bed domain-containing protein 1-like protein [Lasius niger]|uniref:Zinc finger bed domain-containing protein 1-like protein n=1 Tax=Lasius niger TaxID=67767 RepID=A0A0J7K400_LASNI|nr:zinc finger bed domain-containing protein 1-like protein [Lasius niger]
MLAKDEMPYSTVEKEGFNTFVRYAIPLYKIPDRKTIISLIEGKYDVLSNMIKHELSTIKNIALTTDIWTDQLNTKSFLRVTSHFIRGDEYKSIVIGVTAFSNNHTVNYIKDWLLKTVKC